MSTLVRYAAVGLAVVALGGIAGTVLGDERTGAAVWVAGVLALVVQLPAFAILQHVRRRPDRFMMGWLGGMGLRLALVLVVALWVTRTGMLAAAPLLLSLVAYLFVLVLIEPMFLREGTRSE